MIFSDLGSTLGDLGWTGEAAYYGWQYTQAPWFCPAGWKAWDQYSECVPNDVTSFEKYPPYTQSGSSWPMCPPDFLWQDVRVAEGEPNTIKACVYDPSPPPYCLPGVWDTSTKRCITCPTGTTLNINLMQCVSTSPTTCPTCPPQPSCPPGYLWNTGAKGCVAITPDCPSGYARDNGGDCVLAYCQSGYLLDPVTRTCKAPTVCPTCPGPCPTGYARDAIGACVKVYPPCASGYARNSSGTCVRIYPAPLSPCTSGYARDASGVCVPLYPAPVPCPTPDACPPPPPAARFPWLACLSAGLGIAAGAAVAIWQDNVR